MAITSNIQINKNGLCVNEVENIIINDKKRDISSVSSGAEKKEAIREKVFIIHGHNEGKWRELQSILQSINIEAIELSMVTMNGKTIIEKFENIASQCKFAIAIFTYDDSIHKGDKNYLQVRPNVIFELGWFFAKLGRENVMIIEEINSEGRIFSDLDGIYRYKFHDNIKELYGDIINALKEANIIQ